MPYARIALKCLVDSYACEDVEPGGFVSLNDLYENNFIRIRKLIPQLDQLHQLPATSVYSVSRVKGCMDLHLHILEKTRFTTTFILTYHFPDPDSPGQGFVSEPQLKCRVYQDAGLVEVLTGHLHHGKQRFEHFPANAKKVKWRLNRLLYKWLGFSLYLGHAFTDFDADVAIHASLQDISLRSCQRTE